MKSPHSTAASLHFIPSFIFSIKIKLLLFFKTFILDSYNIHQFTLHNCELCYSNMVKFRTIYE
jgi:hypothetical protein